jgi:hypothetical protein
LSMSGRESSIHLTIKNIVIVLSLTLLKCPRLHDFAIYNSGSFGPSHKVPYTAKYDLRNAQRGGVVTSPGIHGRAMGGSVVRNCTRMRRVRVQSMYPVCLQKRRLDRYPVNIDVYPTFRASASESRAGSDHIDSWMEKSKGQGTISRFRNQ